MSPCILGVGKRKQKKSLSTHAAEKQKLLSHDKCKGIPLFAGIQEHVTKASLTLEAAVIFPLFAGFVVSILFFFRILQVETAVSASLSYGCRKAATFASVAKSDSSVKGMGIIGAEKELAKFDVVNKYVKFGIPGVSFWESAVTDEQVVLTASYKIKFPIKFFLLEHLSVTQRQVNRKWTGEYTISQDKEDPYVYVTPEGSVYHQSPDCKYLDLSVHSANWDDIYNLRNRDGARYFPCPKCSKKTGEKVCVFITDYGELFHTDRRCSYLKRTIGRIHLSETNRPPCKKCVGEHGNSIGNGGG